MKLVVDRAIPFAGAMFAGQAEVVLADGHAVTSALVRDADALLVRSVTKVDEALLRDSAVRFVGTATIGYDHIDTGYLSRRGIAFASAPGSNANSVAEYITAALLVLSRRGLLVSSKPSESSKSSNTSNSSNPPNASKSSKSSNTPTPLSNLTIGVVGAGNVGSKVIKKAQALGMRVVVNDPPLERSGAPGPFIPLGVLLQEADIVTLHVPLTLEGEFATKHLFGEKNLGRLKEGAILMNTSRGAVVETAALKRAIAAGLLGAVVLDVWEGEPAIDPELLAAVSIGTPHIAGYSTDGKVNGAMMIYDAACRHFNFPRLFTAAGRLPAPEFEEIRIPDPSPAVQSNSSDVSRLSQPSNTSKPSKPSKPSKLSKPSKSPNTSKPSNSSNESNYLSTLADIVTKVYPIERDDAQLRGLLKLPREKHAAFFRELRGAYPVRREFAATTVVAPDGPLAAALTGLGFAHTFHYIPA